VCPQRPHVTRIDLTVEPPVLIRARTPGAMKLLHFLQNVILSSYGILILYFVLICLASEAWRWDSSGFSLALDTALSIRILILSSAICLVAGFTQFGGFPPKNLF